MSDTDIALERSFGVAVDRGLGKPYAPAVIRLADLLRHGGLPASRLADEKACAIPVEAIEHLGAGFIAR
jgi:hypothetical protein